MTSYAKNMLLGLVNNIALNASSNAINKFERRIKEKRAVRAGKVFTLFISNKDIDDIIKIIKSWETSRGINWWSSWSNKSWN